jgi:hypothetical protein
MLGRPNGLNKSVERHNINFNAFCDWIEGSVLFDQAEISGVDIVDVLLEEDIYVSQDFAWEMVNNAWREISRRQSWLGHSAAIRVSTRLHSIADWRNRPALAFCLALSFTKWYPGWANNLPAGFTEQGELFELVVKESLHLVFPGWQVYHTGWTQTNPINLNQIVKEVTARLGEIEGQLEPWTSAKANDAGLDLLCYLPFMDSRVGVPVLMMQCASGANWENKLHTPNLDVWTKLVAFASRPKKAFSIPYALSDGEFIRSTAVGNSVFLDRYRLLSAGRENQDWMSVDLRARINTWLEPRIAALPRME